MTGSLRDRRGDAAAFLDGFQSFGLVVLLFGLPFSEALKSIGLAVATAGFLGKVALGVRPRPGRWEVLAALALYFCVAALSVAAAEPDLSHPRQLFTLGMTVVPYVLVADACARRTRRLLFAMAIVAGAALAAVLGYFSHMLGPYQRLVLGSIENAVPAAEYLAAALMMAAAMLAYEFASPLAGPLWALGAGSVAIVLLMTKSRGPLLGAIVGVIVTVGVAFRRRRHALATAAVAVAAIVFFAVVNPGARLSEALSPGSRTVGIRATVWKESTARMMDQPLLGYGLGSFSDLRVYYTDAAGRVYQMNAHNTVLHSSCETGILGAGTLVLFVVLGLAGMARACRLTGGLGRAVSVGALGGVVALLVAGVSSVVTDAEPGMLFFALIALGSAGVPRRGRRSGMGSRPAAFLDRDGTITAERGYVTRPEDLSLIDGAAGAVKALNDAGILAVVVSNQSGVARGLMTEEDMAAVHGAMETLLAEGGARLDGAYYCPNHPEGVVERYSRDASCRKPALGMLEQAVRDLDVDVSSSVMVGDQVSDVEFAANAGMPAVVVMTGKGRATVEEARGRGLPVAAAVPDLAAAVKWILEGGSGERRKSGRR